MCHSKEQQEPLKYSRWRLLPSVPQKQPANIETQIDAPANEESIRQHCRAAVNVAITIPTRRKTAVELSVCELVKQQNSDK